MRTCSKLAGTAARLQETLAPPRSRDPTGAVESKFKRLSSGKAGQTEEESPEAGRLFAGTKLGMVSRVPGSAMAPRAPRGTCRSAGRPLRPPSHPRILFPKGPVRLHIRSGAETGAPLLQRKQHTPSSYPNTALHLAVPVAAMVSDRGLEPGQWRGMALAWLTAGASSSVVCPRGGCMSQTQPTLKAEPHPHPLLKGPRIFSAEVSSGVINGHCHPPNSSHTDTHTPAKPSFLF